MSKKKTNPLKDTVSDPLDELRGDFELFAEYMWKFLGLPPLTKQQRSVARYLGQIRPDSRKMVQGFRGLGKSWTTCAYVLWRLLKNPNEKILVVSASNDKARDFTQFCLRLLREMPILSHLRPRDDQRQSMESFDVNGCTPAKDASVTSKGITGQITGGRATIIVADDVEVPKNSETPVMREKLSGAVTEFSAIILPGGEILYLGTPQSEDSLYNRLTDRGFEIRVWPARYPDEDYVRILGITLDPTIYAEVTRNPRLAGQPTDPQRFNDEDLRRRELDYGKAGFRLQFMLDTRMSDEDRFPLKLRDLVVMPLDHRRGPDTFTWSNAQANKLNDIVNLGLRGDGLFKPILLPDVRYEPYQQLVISVDPSGRGTNETAYAVLAYLFGNIFLLDSGGFLNDKEAGPLSGDEQSTSFSAGINKLVEVIKKWERVYDSVALQNSHNSLSLGGTIGGDKNSNTHRGYTHGNEQGNTHRGYTHDNLPISSPVNSPINSSRDHKHGTTPVHLARLPFIMQGVALQSSTKPLVIVEANYGGGMYTQMLSSALRKAGSQVGVEEVKHSRQKELRIIDTLEPIISSHRLVVSEDVIRQDHATASQRPVENPMRYSLFWQMARITRERNALPIDDRLDALAIGVAYWAEQEGLAHSPLEAAKSRREEYFQAELQRHMETQVDPLWREYTGGGPKASILG